MTRCGICRVTGGSGDQDQILCSSCTNFQLLRPKLDYIQSIKELDQYKASVNNVLRKCIQGENISFLTKYIENQDITDTQDHVSIHSIASLSSQLLTIDSISIKRSNNKILKEISYLQSKLDSKRLKLKTLNYEKNEKLSKIQKFKSNSSTNEIYTKINEISSNSLNIQKQINNSQSILFQELINIYNIKKRKISGSNQPIFLISFNPIISIANIIMFPIESINSSLIIMTKFVYQISQIWFINLPFNIIFSKENLYEPKILDFNITLPTDSTSRQLWDVSNYDLKLFLNSLSRLIVNIYEILKFFKLNSNIKSYKQLFKIDELIYKIINNNYELSSKSDDSNEIENEKIDIDDLISLIYKYLNNKINDKINEWEFVKNEVFIDEE